MTAIKKLIKKSKSFLFIITALCYVVISFFLAIEAVFTRLNDCLFNKLAWLFNIQGSFRKRFYKKMSKHVPPFRYQDSWAKKIQKEFGPLRVSFAEAVFHRNAYNSDKLLPEWRINSKYNGIRFAREMDLRIPKQFQQHVTFSEILPVKGTVIKPINSHSANGVFIVNDVRNINELNTGKALNSWDHLNERVLEYLKCDPKHEDLWLVEQLITGADGQIANDIKFFAFYGRIEVIAEMKRFPRIFCDMIDINNVSFESGLYSNDYNFKGQGVSRSEINLAEKISLEIPVPFIRIDFLRGVDGLYFCEFTPRPGSVGAFNRKYDQLLGKMYHEAQARLSADLISGKKFDTFNRATT